MNLEDMNNDPKIESYEFRKGYNEGYQEGYNNAIKKYLEEISLARSLRPIQVFVPNEQLELIKEIEYLNKDDFQEKITKVKSYREKIAELKETNKDTLYKVATKYQYKDDVEVCKPGMVFKESPTVEYQNIEGLEFTLEDIGKLIIAVDDMFYDISNQWEDGMNIESFIGVVRDYMYC